jgi:hypothetical protein
VAPSAWVVPVNDLPAAIGSAASYVVLGAGKTAVDACVWLLDNDVQPDRIRWIRPRDAWFYDRRHFQPLEQVAAIMEGISRDAEAGAQAASVEELFARLEGSGRLVRIDPSYPAVMYRGTMLSAGELDAVRQVEDVVRLGRVVRVQADRIVLERGETATSTDALHVDCTALGLRDAPATPIFAPGRIVLQQVRHLSPCFNAALIAFVEARRDEDADKNRLCPPNPYPKSIWDWPRMISRTWRTEARWLTEPDLSAWVANSRLNLLRALPDHAAEPPAQTAIKGFVSMRRGTGAAADCQANDSTSLPISDTAMATEVSSEPALHAHSIVLTQSSVDGRTYRRSAGDPGAPGQAPGSPRTRSRLRSVSKRCGRAPVLGTAAMVHGDFRMATGGDGKGEWSDRSSL